MINSRKLEDLLPVVEAKVRLFVEKCKEQDIDILITSTYRDLESQNVIYQQGRTTPGFIVTKAPAGKSFHNWRVAADFVPLVNGKPNWRDVRLFERCGVIAESCGLEWAGRWKKMQERAHVQYTGGKKLLWFQSGGSL